MASKLANELLNALLPHAKNLLSKYGEFYPFGVQASASGEIALIAGLADDSDHPSSQAVIDFLIAAMRTEADKNAIVGCGICHDGRVQVGDSGSQDAICVRVETKGGESIALYLPYAMKTKLFSKSRDVTYGEISGSIKKPEIWTAIAS